MRFEVVPNCGRETSATVKHADRSESKCTGSEAEQLLKKVKEEWKWQRADGDMGAYGGFAEYKAPQ